MYMCVYDLHVVHVYVTMDDNFIDIILHGRPFCIGSKINFVYMKSNYTCTCVMLHLDNYTHVHYTYTCNLIYHKIAE